MQQTTQQQQAMIQQQPTPTGKERKRKRKTDQQQLSLPVPTLNNNELTPNNAKNIKYDSQIISNSNAKKNILDIISRVNHFY